MEEVAKQNLNKRPKGTILIKTMKRDKPIPGGYMNLETKKAFES